MATKIDKIANLAVQIIKRKKSGRTAGHGRSITGVAAAVLIYA